MEELIRVARTLRRDHGFAGYIHLKAIPEASPWLDRAGRPLGRPAVDQPRAADASAASPASRRRSAAPTIDAAMGQMHERIAEAKAERRRFCPRGPEHAGHRRRRRHHRRAVLAASARLYDRYGLTRVYYSAFSPIPEPSAALPLKPPPLLRENRLYQADWLIRFYGFTRR